MSELKMFNGCNNFKDIVYSEEFKDMKRKHGRYARRAMKDIQTILKGDIIEVKQTGFTDDIILTVLFDNRKDLFGFHMVKVIAPSYTKSEFFKPQSNVYIEVAVKFLDKEEVYGYPVLQLTRWLSMDKNLMFPHYMCPSCGKDYGVDKELADHPERQYCDICADSDNSDLVLVYNRDDYKNKIKHHLDL